MNRSRYLLAFVLLFSAHALWAQSGSSTIIRTPSADSLAARSDADAAQDKALMEARRLLQSGHAQQAIDDYIDKVLAYYENKYAGSKQRIFVTRSSEEALLYSLQAASEHRDAVVIPGGWSSAYYMKGYALLELRQVGEAQAALRKAVELSPQNSQYLAELAHTYDLQKKWDQSLATYKLASEAGGISPAASKRNDLSRACRGQGYALVELRRLEEAETQYRDCLTIDPQDQKSRDELQYVRGQRSK